MSIFLFMINFNWPNLLGKEFAFKCPVTNLFQFLTFNLFNIEGESQGSFMLPALYMCSLLKFIT